MSVLRAERIKLFSTRAPWWCSAVAVLLVVGVTGAVSAWSPSMAGMLLFVHPDWFLQPGLMVILVMATLSATTEYRFSTVRVTFTATPNRTVALLAKAVVVAALAGVVGLTASFGAWGLTWLTAGDAARPLRSGHEWRVLAGAGAVFALAAVLAVAVGLLVRHTAAAVTLLLVWTLLVESAPVLPGVGERIAPWLPFANAGHFLVGDRAVPAAAMPFGPWVSLSYFAGVTAGLFVIAVAVVRRRDA